MNIMNRPRPFAIPSTRLKMARTRAVRIRADGGVVYQRGGNCELGAGATRFAVGAFAVKPITAQLMSIPTLP